MIYIIGRGAKIINRYVEEDELQEEKDYIVAGAGILQRGACCRDLSEPSNYDVFFDTVEECEEYIKALEECGYGNTISGPYVFFHEIKFKRKGV